MPNSRSIAQGTHCAAVVAVCSLLWAGCGNETTQPAGTHVEYQYRNSHSGAEKRAEVFVPPVADTVACPLLVYAHYYGGQPKTARELGYHDECAKRGWYCVCPLLHGREFVQHPGFGSLEAQHDILDAVAYMRANYRIDSTRIYIAGRSMGGQMAQLMAAKHPDLFAAAVAGQGISDMKSWVESGTRLKQFVEDWVCGGPYGDSTAFEYARRSSQSYAVNLQYVPLVLWHGTNDPLVTVEQTRDLYAAIRKHSPWHPQPRWFIGAPHGGLRFPVGWICDELAIHQNTSEPSFEVVGRYFDDLELVTDEDKAFFWLRLSLRRTGEFGRVSAALRGDSVVVASTNLDTVTVLAGRLADKVQVRAFRAEMGGPGVVCLERGGQTVASAAVSGNGSGTLGDE